MAARGSRPAWRRWLFSVALFYGFVLAAGAMAGLAGAIDGERLVSGQDATVVHHPNPAHDPPGAAPTVSKLGTTPDLRFLLLFPAVALLYATIFLLPVLLVALAVVELAAFLGAPERALRIAGLLCAMALAAMLPTSSAPGPFFVVTAALLGFGLLARPPSAKVSVA